MGGLYSRIKAYVDYHGVSYTIYRAGEKALDRIFRPYNRYWNRYLKPTEQCLAQQRQSSLDAGLISVIVPVYNTDPTMLKEMARSIMDQTYTHWEAVLYDDCSPSQDTVKTLAEISAWDPRFRIHRGEVNQGISGSSNRAVSLSKGEWIALLDHDDLLTPDALYSVAEAVLKDEPDLIYSDEDKVTQNGQIHTDPHFKPDFCPDNLRSGNYICHLMVIRRSLFEKAGGFRHDYNGSQDHDLALRCVANTDHVTHIPKVLYHWRTVKSSVSHQNLMRCVEATVNAVNDHIKTIGNPGSAFHNFKITRIKYDIIGKPMVGIYIFGDDQAQLSVQKNALEQMDYPLKSVHSIFSSKKTRYAEMNKAANAAKEDILMFMDASVKPVDDQFLIEMLMYAQREDVGAVTPELTTPRGHVTHAGFAVDMSHLIQCRHAGLYYKSAGWHLLMRTSHNVAAVSQACMMFRKDHFIPFDEDYISGIGSVDWCLRLIQNGKRHVFTPFARGICTDKSLLLLGNNRNRDDVLRYQQKWQKVKDPCYSRLFSRKKANYRLRRKSEHTL